jgi:hypothetical protein
MILAIKASSPQLYPWIRSSKTIPKRQMMSVWFSPWPSSTAASPDRTPPGYVAILNRPLGCGDRHELSEKTEPVLLTHVIPEVHF